MGEDRSTWASSDPERLDQLVAEARRREKAGATLDEIAMWLKSETASFGDSGEVLSVVRGIPTIDAYLELRATRAWRDTETRFHVVLPTGAVSEFHNANGKTFRVGEVLIMPHIPESPHHAEEGRGTVWRVTGVETDEDPAFTARLLVEPVRRLEAKR